MLQYLIKITDNTLAATIAVSFLLVLSIARAPYDKKKYLVWGAVLGAVTALGYAVLKRNTGFAVREYYDLGVMLPSVVFSLIFLPLLWRAFKLQAVGAKLFKAVSAVLLGLWLAYCLPNIFLSPFEFAVGMETIYNTDFLYKVVGYAGGLLIMLLLGMAICRTAGRAPRGLLLAVAFLVIFIFMLQQALEVSQILVGRGLIPRYRWLLSLVIALLTHKDWITGVFMGLAAFMAIALIIQVRLTPLAGANPAQVRKMRAGHRSLLRHSGLIMGCLLVSLVTITLLRDLANRDVEISPPVEISAVDGRVTIPLEQINDGNLHRHQYRAEGGTAVRFIVIKKSETAYGVGLDACDICGPTGYYQRGDQVVCKLCDVVMNKSTIGFPGGCNPVPLEFSISEGRMIIEAEELESEKARFE